MTEEPRDGFGAERNAGGLDRPPPHFGQGGHAGADDDQDRTRLLPPKAPSEDGRVIGSASAPMPRHAPVQPPGEVPPRGAGRPGPPPRAGGPPPPPPPQWGPPGSPPPQWAPQGPPPAGQGGPGHGGPGVPPGPPPNNHMAFAILATVLCCLPLGVVGIVKASEVNNRWAVGDYAGARDASESARKFAMWSMILGGSVIALIVIVYAVMIGVVASSGSY